MRKLVFWLIAAVIVLGSVVPAAAQDQSDIVDLAIADGRFTTLVAAVQAAGLVDTLKGEGPFTVFAPTDDAFAKLPAGTVEGLLQDIPALTNILTYHVVAGEVMAADVVNLTTAEPVQGLPIKITVRDGNVFLNDNVQVIITDIEASNGVIHVIDTVLLPPLSVSNEGSNNINFRAGPGLDQTILDTFGVGDKAPAIGRNAEGDWVQIELNGQTGWVFAALVTLSGDLQTLSAGPGTIVELAAADGRFTTLLAAVQAAGLADELSGTGPFTVFAPTDDAFAKLSAGTVESLLANIPTLQNILLYHVVEGKVMAADVVNLTSATSLSGSPITVTMRDGKVFLNDSVEVIITDIEAANGVIHVIDSVLLPPGM
jgi:uncharacterized surface protein with fasciclin (FAS1) repeats